ncbi:hypothetical protein G9A89_008780 [Geosiphon pyriformis]|nr:hypothetical protein G9A89_008780 [Geosiphon pyriformis]
MSTNVHDETKKFLSSIFETKDENQGNNIINEKISVTLTYAQSLDAKIGYEGGKQLILSCKESMIMTHRLRTMHDGILVGIGTIFNDDPQLTARHLGLEKSIVSQPQPIILDSHLRFPLNARLLTQVKEVGKSPWIFTSIQHDVSKRALLEKAGARICVIDYDQNGYCSLPHLLSILRYPPFSISKLMVEGGAKIIKSFLLSGLVDQLIITIAPIFVGINGISAFDLGAFEKDRNNENNGNLPEIDQLEYKQFGKDIFVVEKATQIFQLQKNPRPLGSRIILKSVLAELQFNQEYRQELGRNEKFWSESTILFHQVHDRIQDDSDFLLLGLWFIRLLRNLVAMIPENQDRSLYDLNINFFVELVVAILRSGSQALSNILTANSFIQGKLWEEYMADCESGNILCILVSSGDDETLLSTLVLIYQCIHESEERSKFLVESKVGLRLLKILLNEAEKRIEDEKSKCFELIYSVISRLIDINLFPSLFKALNPSSNRPNITYHQITLLKLLDSKLYLISKSAHMTSPAIPFDSCIYLVNLLNIFSPVVIFSMQPNNGNQNYIESGLPKEEDMVLLNTGIVLLLQSIGNLIQVGDNKLRVSLFKEGVIPNCIALLQQADLTLTRVTRSQSTPVDQTSQYKKGLCYIKRDIVKVIGNMAYENQLVQDEVRRLGGIQLILNQCNIDDNNPYIREHAIFAIRNLLQGNIENQKLINELAPVNAVQNEVLRDARIETELDKDAAAQVISEIAPNSKNYTKPVVLKNLNKIDDKLDEKLDSEIVFEFGGPWGVTAMMLGFPLLMFYMWGCLQFYHGQVISPFNPELWKLVIEGATPTWYATKIYVLFCLFELFLAFSMPGPIVLGAPVSALKGKKLEYICNGVTCWYTTLVASYILNHFGWFPLTDIIDHFGPLMTVSIISGFVITIAVYSITIIQGNQYRMSGYLAYDLFMGAALNPRLGRVDLKMFAEIRVPWVIYLVSDLWLLINQFIRLNKLISAAIKEYQLFGNLSPSMTFMVLAHFLYVNACMKGEECIPTTWDMTYEKFGYMLIFWNYAGVPFTYCYSTLYIHFSSVENGAPLDHSLSWTIFCYALLLGGYYIWDTANSQKNRFRMITNGTYIPRKTFPQLPWGTLKNPTFIKTTHGNLLLTSGWWGIARKIHYTADLMMAFAWAFITGFHTIIPFFYPVFFVIVLVHRVTRDMERCAKKYGKDWQEYCKNVPYIFIPGVY